MNCGHGFANSIRTAAEKIDPKNRRRIVRALEICLLSGKPASEVVARLGESGRAESTIPTRGVFVFRHREDLYERINQRAEIMFERGVIEEVRDAGVTSATASQMIGLREIRQLLAGKESLTQCLTEIQQATRRYAKRQLTWFRRQTSFLPEAEEYAARDYPWALSRGSRLTARGARRARERLAGPHRAVRGAYVDRADLRIEHVRFFTELLRDRTAGGGPARRAVHRPARPGNAETWDADPSMDAIAGAYAAALNHYVRDRAGRRERRLVMLMAEMASKEWSFKEFEGKPVDVGGRPVA